MALSQSEIDDLVDDLYEAYETKTAIKPVSDDTEFTTEEAYTVQSRVFDRIHDEDNRRIGHKLGLVSEAKQEQLGILEPIFAPVIEEMVLDENVIPTEELIAPRIEAEIGLIIDEDVPEPVTTADVLSATRAVVPVAEVLESRYQGWTIPSAQDVIADLTSASYVIVGESLANVTDVDLPMESVVVSVNGEIEETGVGADIMGHPARAVSWLGNRLEDRDDGLSAGDLVMTGGITAAIDVEPGDVYHIEFGSIGSIEVRAA
ncbi:2-keto-4-pentenoate hydratase [Halococcus sp. IIIV-5B]|uniref:2-keto-4-pentenoate hydratase n=1 Tax=Halococcus sp. IIIV-5B TaxID=2321230 RepID=UPI000E7338F5|nr:fumarylacetoacetate hydrolase family protein [Halococcus sp. IIIV-5B]RJT05492.1 2-oxopent-4-enoate hydratase [Halococcus sp. IIIV-5B]